jgi:geranyl-CoA carboxylase alpha subunit
LPQTGKVLRWKPATLPNVRIDHGMLATDEVSPFYDPMVAKVIAYGKPVRMRFAYWLVQ